jgi:hypothetical protein
VKLPLLGGSGEDRFDDNSSQLTQNWYPHTASSGKSKLALYPTPGLTLFKDIGVGPIRGSIDYGGVYFVISGDELYEVDAAGNSVLRGTINTTTGVCKLAHNGANNGKQICIVDGTNGYIWNSLYSTFSQIKQFSIGTADTNTLNKLEDSGATFVTDGVVAGTIVYNTTDGTKGTVSAVDSQIVLSIVDSAGAAYDLFPLGTEAYEVGTDAFPDTATHVEFVDGYFLWNDPTNSGRFYKSASYDGTDVNALEFATAEQAPDELEGFIKVDKLVWLIGHHTAEPWFNSDAFDFPFEPVLSGFSEWGTAAKYSIVQTSGLAFWLSENDDGDRMIVMAQGLQVKIVSTPEIAAEIAAMTDITDCYAFTYQKFQHTFICFTFPKGQKTLVFDTTEKLWHTWSSKDLGYHRSTGHTFIYNKHLVGDPVTGRIYELDWDNYTDNNEPITRKRISATFHADDKDVEVEVVELDIKEGAGIAVDAFFYTGTATTFGSQTQITDINSDFIALGVRVGDTFIDPSGAGIGAYAVSGVFSEITAVSKNVVQFVSFEDQYPFPELFNDAPSVYEIKGTRSSIEPKIHLRWRDNNGAWSNYHSRSMGKIGETNKKVRWRRQGQFSSRVYEITTSDAVTPVILDGYARIKIDQKEFR